MLLLSQLGLNPTSLVDALSLSPSRSFASGCWSPSQPGEDDGPSVNSHDSHGRTFRDSSNKPTGIAAVDKSEQQSRKIEHRPKKTLRGLANNQDLYILADTLLACEVWSLFCVLKQGQSLAYTISISEVKIFKRA